MKRLLAIGSLVATGCCCGIAHGDFGGPYAPDQWTFTPGPGGAMVEHTASILTFKGGDTGSAGNTDVTVISHATGTWSFDWTLIPTADTACFDEAYYLVNDEAIYLGCANLLPIGGSITTWVRAGDVIGFRVRTVDGLFGPGTMSITAFSAPVPVPAASLLLLGFGLPPCRQRREAPL